MSNKKIIAVIGSTGFQGGSVVDIFLNDAALKAEWVVRAITRDPSKEKAKKLVERGAEAVAGDLNDKDSLVKAFAGATAVFGVTNYWETLSIDTEIQQGKNIVDAAKEAGVSHFIFSSLLDVVTVDILQNRLKRLSRIFTTDRQREHKFHQIGHQGKQLHHEQAQADDHMFLEGQKGENIKILDAFINSPAVDVKSAG
ncbi:hypothetical protein FSST1_013010 [Fusarium sambucinum]